MKSRLSSFWEILGKFSVILGILAGCIAGYDFLMRKSEHVYATGFYDVFALPPDVVKLLDSIDEKGRSYNLSSFLKEEENIKLNLTQSQKLDLRDNLETWLDFGDILTEYRFSKYSSFIYLKVFNDGDLTAENVILDLPVSGIALVTNQDSSKETLNFKKEIQLNDIRANNGVAVAIWSENSISEIDETDFKISHENGLGKVEFGKKVYGFSKFFANNKERIIAFLIFFLLIIPKILQVRVSPIEENEKSE